MLFSGAPGPGAMALKRSWIAFAAVRRYNFFLFTGAVGFVYCNGGSSRTPMLSGAKFESNASIKSVSDLMSVQ
jgi:hypothetical protein